MCRLWGGITPHASGHPGSIWDLPYSTWVIFRHAADDYVKRMKQQEASGGR